MVRRVLLIVLGVVAVAAPSGAQFLAADLIYLPGVAHTSGVGDSRWRTDIFITNVEDDASIDVAMVFIQTGLISNASAFIDRSLWLGGREDDGFGFVDPVLADIPPGGTAILRDPIGSYWGTSEGAENSGAIVAFIYESGTLQEDGSRELKDAIINTRTYTPFTFYQPDPEDEESFVEVEGTYGQTLPGVPWYNLADPSAVDEDVDFSFQVLTGAAEDDDYRYNVGIVNASDPLTTITLIIQPFRGDGEPFLDTEGNEILRIVTMPPSSHVQYDSALLTLFDFASAPDDVRIDVSFLNWTSSSSEPIVGMTTYGTYIDNNTNDPTAILPAFAHPYDVECQWAVSGGGDAKTGGVTRRPVTIPPR